MVETWEKDEIGIAKILLYSHFPTARYGYGNIQSGNTTQGYVGIATATLGCEHTSVSSQSQNFQNDVISNFFG